MKFRTLKIISFLFTIIVVTTMSTAQTMSLDGEWQFAVDTAGIFSIHNVKKSADWRTSVVPLSWQAQFSDLRDYQGVAWYRKSFTIPKLKSSETAIVRFGAVDYYAKVFVNGFYAGEHEGGYLPFEIDIRQWINKGENEIIVRVMDPLAMEKGTEGISYWHIPHGKQNWYVQTSGLWQSVDLQIKPKRHITQVHITPEMDGSFTFDVWFNRAPDSKVKGSLTIRITEPGKSEVLIIKQSINSASTEIKVKGKIESPQFWSFDIPNLYAAQICFNTSDIVCERFGFRSIEAKDQKLLLNGKQFFLIGALDQDFYPETIYTVPSEDYLRDEMLKAKKLGLNTLRCHIKVPDPLYLKVADEVGLLVWYEIPNWDVFTHEAAMRGEVTLNGMLSRDWNHPSLCIISLSNESWGIDMQKSEQRAWLKEAFIRAKQKAIGRLVVDNSACWGNFHVKTDINDYHTYWAIPENRLRFDQTVDDVASRPDWLFSKFGDAEETKQEPLILSEFGNWGLPKLAEQQPWWFERKFGDAKVAHPLGVEQRFKDFHYDRIFGTYDQLAEESQLAQWEALKYEIEQIRLKPGIEGYVITEFTDVNWECNGLMDMWRNPKLLSANIGNIQQQDIVIPKPVRYNYRSGDTVEIRLVFSHYSKQSLDGAHVKWRSSAGNDGIISFHPGHAGNAVSLDPVHFIVPAIAAPERIRIDFETISETGQMLAKNYAEIFVYPHVQPSANIPLVVYDPMKTLAPFTGLLRSKGYLAASRNDISPIIITNTLDKTILDFLEKGMSIVCLTDTNTQLPSEFPAKLLSRESAWYDGNWASNLNWVDITREPFKSLNFGKRVGFEGSYALPQMLLTEIKPDNFPDVLSGMFVGWLHLNSAYMLQMNAGRGKLLVSCFRLAENFGSDPYSETLFADLIHYVTSSQFQPTLTSNLK